MEFLATWQVRRPSDDALGLGRRTGCRKRDRRVGGMTPRFLPVPWPDSNLQPAVWSVFPIFGRLLSTALAAG